MVSVGSHGHVALDYLLRLTAPWVSAVGELALFMAWYVQSVTWERGDGMIVPSRRESFSDALTHLLALICGVDNSSELLADLDVTACSCWLHALSGLVVESLILNTFVACQLLWTFSLELSILVIHELLILHVMLLLQCKLHGAKNIRFIIIRID